MGTRRRHSRRCGSLRNGGNIRRNAKRFRVRNGKEKSSARPRDENSNILPFGCDSVAGSNACKRHYFDCRARFRIRLAGVYLRASRVVHRSDGVHRDMEEKRFVVFKRFGAYMDGNFIAVSVAFVYPQHGASVRSGRAARIYGGTVVFPSVCQEKIELSAFFVVKIFI